MKKNTIAHDTEQSTDPAMDAWEAEQAADDREDPEANRKRLDRLIEDLRRADPETINAIQAALDFALRR